MVVWASDRPRSAIISTQVSQAQLEAKIPAHAQDDDLAVEVATLEQLLDALFSLLMPTPPAARPTSYRARSCRVHHSPGEENLPERAGREPCRCQALPERRNDLVLGLMRVQSEYSL